MKVLVSRNFWGMLLFFCKKGNSTDEEKYSRENGGPSAVVVVDSDVWHEVYSAILNDRFGRVTSLDIACQVNEKLLSECNELLSGKKVRQVILSVSEVYRALHYPEFLVGIERWQLGDSPEKISQLDSSVLSIFDCIQLIPYADRIVDHILHQNPVNDLEKILLVDVWLQRYVQYAIGQRTSAHGGIYYCPEMIDESKAEDALCRHYGRCEDIAFAAAMILNHPRIGIYCRQVASTRNDSFNHSWNIIAYEGQEYYTDFTHNITRSQYLYPGALKATAYSSQYTLLGVGASADKYGYTECYSNAYLSKVSFSREEIIATLNRLSEASGLELTWSDKPVLVSYYEGT